MKENQKLNAKQTEFCRCFVKTRNGREAAIAAGFPIFPDKTANKLLSSVPIQKKIAALEKEEQAGEAELIAGYRRLAFGSAADAVKLVLTCDDPEAAVDTDALDLFMVSEIKRPKGGGMEIKFFDRLKALEKLSELRTGTKETAEPFYKALEKSALALQSDGESVVCE